MTNFNIDHGGETFIKKRHPKVKRHCFNCGKEFLVWQSRIKIGKGKFCSTRCGKSGINAWNWKGGIKNASGYIKIKDPEHPNADLRGYVPQHRLVMESYLGRYLTTKEVVHHINHNRDDNRIENLILMNGQSKHYIEHMKGNKIWLGKKHKPETIIKMKQSWTEKRKQNQAKRNIGQGNPNYRHGKYIKENL